MPIIFMLVGTMILLFIVKKIYSKNWNKKLGVTLRFQEENACEGGEAYITETIRNEKWLPVPLLHVKFQTDRACDFHQGENASVSDMTYKNDIFSLESYSQVKRTIPFTCRKRGVYHVKQADLVTGFLFFRSIRYDKRTQDTSLVVYPSTVEMEKVEKPIKEVIWSSKKKAGLLSDPFSFAGIREYQSSDPLKAVNWKATAHTYSLMVNTYEKTAGQPVVILVNLQMPIGRKGEDLLEESIRLAVTWAEGLMEAGIPFRVLTNRDDDFDQMREESWDELNTRMAHYELKSECRSFAEWMDEDVLPHIRDDACYGVISFDELDIMRNRVLELAQLTDEVWLIRPCTPDAEKVYYPGNVHVFEWIRGL
jgi:uncharacterized protein (DUF58 family)